MTRFAFTKSTLAILATCTALARVATADYIDFNDGSRREFGLTISQTDQHIELQQTDLSGKRVNRKFLRDNVKSHVITVDSRRLEALVPGDWNAYRDLAEDLASLKNDPVAREFSIRLFALCLANGGREIRSSAATNLPGLARTAAETKQFEVLAFLYGQGTLPGRTIKQPNVDANNVILQLTRLLRMEQFEAASRLLSEAGTQEAMAATGWLQPKKLSSAIARKQIDSSLRVKLLRLESRLLRSQQSDVDASTSWIDSIEQLPVEVLLFRVEDVFPFDLKATIFRNNQWIAPGG